MATKWRSNLQDDAHGVCDSSDRKPIGFGEEIPTNGTAWLVRTVGKDELLKCEPRLEWHTVGVEFVAPSRDLIVLVTFSWLPAEFVDWLRYRQTGAPWCVSLSWDVRTRCTGVSGDFSNR